MTCKSRAEFLVEEESMKKIALILSLVASLFLVNPLFARDYEKSDLVSLDESSFVVVRDRGNDDTSVMLYRVIDGKLQLVDVLLVDGDFSNVNRPIVKIAPATLKIQ
jgi:hypothetical protein